MAICFSSHSNAQTLDAAGQLDPTQVYSTGNIVVPTTTTSGSTWANGVYQDQLTCWAWGDPGYCGPNAIVRPGGSINFSYGTTDLYQQQAIANVLPYSGTGLRVNGYNFSFTAKNGNGWDDGRVDNLYAYVNLYGSTNSLLENDIYNLTSKFNWTTFNFNKTYTTPYATQDLNSIRFGFVGNDNNYWAGPYGPEIQQVSFSLKYSVDPCFVNVLSSPTCPGYLEELAKLNPPTTTVSTTITVAEPVVTEVNVAPTTTTATTDTSTPVAEATSTTTSTPTTTTTTTTAAVSTAPATTPAPTVSNPQPKVGEVAQSSSPKSTVSTSQILSIISKEQSRLSTLEQNTVSATTQQANQAASSATQQAEAVAASSQSQSIATSIQAGQQASSSGIASVGDNSGTGISSNAPSVVTSSILGSVSTGQPIGQSNYLLGSSQISSTQIQATQTTQSILSNASNSEESTQAFSITGITFNNILQSQNVPVLYREIEQQEKRMSEVKKNIKDNDAAGGVTLASMQVVPTGFNMYSVGMTDSNFYAPKEIYKGQRNVDNARLLRGLAGGSDLLHQQMVDEQYK